MQTLFLANLFDESLEGFRILDGHLRKDFAIEGDILACLEGNELPVLDAVEAERRVQAGDPEATERAFLGTAIAMSVFASLDHGLLGLGK